MNAQTTTPNIVNVTAEALATYIAEFKFASTLVAGNVVFQPNGRVRVAGKFVNAEVAATLHEEYAAALDAFIAEQEAAKRAEEERIADEELIASYDDTTDEMTVKHAADIMRLSEIRIRRFTTEGKVRYARRGYVVASDIFAEMDRRVAKRIAREAASKGE